MVPADNGRDPYEEVPGNPGADQGEGPGEQFQNEDGDAELDHQLDREEGPEDDESGLLDGEAEDLEERPRRRSRDENFALVREQARNAQEKADRLERAPTSERLNRERLAQQQWQQNEQERI